MKLLNFIRKKLKRPVEHDEYWTGMEIYKALRKNGVIEEKARREGRSLSYEERQIITAVRKMAIDHMKAMDQKYAWLIINIEEASGQRDRDLVFEPYKIVPKFAYYESPYYGHPVAEPSFHIQQSNHPVLIEYGNFGKEELDKYGVKIPKCPTFEKWDAKGRPCYRGE